MQIENKNLEIPFDKIVEPQKTQLKEWCKYYDFKEHKRLPLLEKELKEMSQHNIDEWLKALPKLELLNTYIRGQFSYDIKENINSSFRTKERNKKANGKSTSLHYTGFAIDIQLDGFTCESIIRRMIEFPTPNEELILNKAGFYYIFYKEKNTTEGKNNFFHIQISPFADESKRFAIEIK